jgi:DNA-binding transcriptional regulator GbsR (MarR family)
MTTDCLMTKTYSDILQERERILGTFEALFRMRGMGDLHGRVFGAILLSVNEMTQDEISEFTGYSVPAVSSALDELVRVGLVSKRKRQESRKFSYTSKADLDEILRMVLRTVHDDYVAVVLNQLSVVKKFDAVAGISPQLRGHMENVQNYDRELRDLESYLKRLLEVPMEEKK